MEEYELNEELIQVIKEKQAAVNAASVELHKTIALILLAKGADKSTPYDLTDDYKLVKVK